MTTGRINQVAIFPGTLRRARRHRGSGPLGVACRSVSSEGKALSPSPELVCMNLIVRQSVARGAVVFRHGPVGAGHIRMALERGRWMLCCRCLAAAQGQGRRSRCGRGRRPEGRIELHTHTRYHHHTATATAGAAAAHRGPRSRMPGNQIHLAKEIERTKSKDQC
jgi:hypothetical protein